jgi:hypothetical protein
VQTDTGGESSFGAVAPSPANASAPSAAAAASNARLTRGSDVPHVLCGYRLPRGWNTIVVTPLNESYEFVSSFVSVTRRLRRFPA